MASENSILMISNLTSLMGKGQSVCETMSELLLKRGWKVYTASSQINRILRFSDMLLATLKNRNKYCVAYLEVYSGWAFIWAELISLFLHFIHKPFVLALYGGGLPDFSRKNSRRVKRLLKSAAVVVSPSSFTKDLMLPYHPNIRVLSYGVDFSTFHFRLRTKPSLRLMTMRAFHRVYNLSIAPVVLGNLIEEFPDGKLVMTGGDKHDGSWQFVQDAARECRVGDRVKMLGFVPRADLPGLLDHADILLNTPNVDNTPVSLLEAMACGLCIVSTNVGGIPYLLEDEKDALLVPPDDPQAMAVAVKRILDEPGLAERLSCNARRKAEQFDWSVILPQWEKLFQEITGE